MRHHILRKALFLERKKIGGGGGGVGGGKIERTSKSPTQVSSSFPLLRMSEFKYPASLDEQLITESKAVFFYNC
jgi:hypothetical protein